jgi:hypothetical protein
MGIAALHPCNPALQRGRNPSRSNAGWSNHPTPRRQTGTPRIEVQAKVKRRKQLLQIFRRERLDETVEELVAKHSLAFEVFISFPVRSTKIRKYRMQQ